MARDENKDSDPSGLRDIPHTRDGTRPDYSAPLPRQKLSKALQDKLDMEGDDDSWSSLYDGTAPESTETNVRYAAYATRVRTILLSAHRYVAYTSDIGESFRPIAHPYLVKGAYGVSWLYLLGDVGHEGYKAWLRNQRVLHPEQHAAERKGEEQQPGLAGQIKGAVREVKDAAHEIKSSLAPQESEETVTEKPGRVVPIEDYKAVMAQRAVFQGIASMGLPAFTIHSIVRYSGQAMKNVKNPRIRTWGPIGLGLAAVPALPYMFDHPVETATEWVFHKAFSIIGGPEAVAGRPEIGREALLQAEVRKTATKEKEL